MTPTVGALIVVLCLILLGVLLVGRWLDERARRLEPTPDTPLSFGDNIGWFAIRTEETAAVVQALGLEGARETNWEMGLAAVEDERRGYTEVFVSPPVNGWTFAVGLALPQPMGAAFTDPLRPLIGRLGRRFSDVQYFLNYPEFDYFSWQRCRDGRHVRAFAATDEGVILSRGRPTDEERALGLSLFELRGVRDRQGDAGGELLLHPTTAHVLMLARVWSLDPTRLSNVLAENGLGYVGDAPSVWKARPVVRTESRVA